jgi:hypothetical protein
MQIKIIDLAAAKLMAIASLDKVSAAPFPTVANCFRSFELIRGMFRTFMDKKGQQFFRNEIRTSGHYGG